MILFEPESLVTPRVPTREARMLDSFLELFDGHFDNHAQVAANDEAGLTPREGGGHEHIHCSLRPVCINGADGAHVLASYYFNGQLQAVFRERLYSFEALSEDEQFGSCVRMCIYKLREDVSSRLRAGGSGATEDVAFTAANDLSEVLRVPEADVFWRWCGERFEGEMRQESLTIVSERSGRDLVVRDDVALWQDALWVNDRGTDAETGAYVYGNIHGVPYKMSRVDDTHWTATGEAPN